MVKQKRRPIPGPQDEAAKRYRLERIFEAADVAYRRASAKTDPDLNAWENALADGIPR